MDGLVVAGQARPGRSSQPACLSMDSDTETPRKGPAGSPHKAEHGSKGEIVTSSLSPRCAAVSEACADDEETVGQSPVRSPPKSLQGVSQTQKYESPGRRAGGGVAFSQPNGNESQTYPYVAEARVFADSQRTMPYVEPHRDSAAMLSWRQDEQDMSAEGQVRQAPSGRAREGAGDGCVNGRVAEDDGGEGEFPCYQALLPNMASQPTPSSQMLVSQTQERYSRLATFGPELLGHTITAQQHSLQMRQNNLPALTLDAADIQPPAKIGLGDEEEVKSDSLYQGAGQASPSKRNESLSTPSRCDLGVSEQGMHESINPSLSIKEDACGDKSSQPLLSSPLPVPPICALAHAAAAHGTVAVQDGAGGGAALPTQQLLLAATAGGKAAQMRREKALVHTSPLLDDLMSQDLRFALPTHRTSAITPASPVLVPSNLRNKLACSKAKENAPPEIRCGTLHEPVPCNKPAISMSAHETPKSACATPASNEECASASRCRSQSPQKRLSEMGNKSVAALILAPHVFAPTSDPHKAKVTTLVQTLPHRPIESHDEQEMCGQEMCRQGELSGTRQIHIATSERLVSHDKTPALAHLAPVDKGVTAVKEVKGVTGAKQVVTSVKEVKLVTPVQQVKGVTPVKDQMREKAVEDGVSEHVPKARGAEASHNAHTSHASHTPQPAPVGKDGGIVASRCPQSGGAGSVPGDAAQEEGHEQERNEEVSQESPVRILFIFIYRNAIDGATTSVHKWRKF